MTQIVATQLGILLIDRNKLYFYEKGISSVFPLELPNSIVRDIEIIDQESLTAQIKSFVQTSKITPAKITIVLSQNMFFEKDFPSNTPDSDLQNYIEYIPFENISYKKLQLANGIKIIATNKNYYEGIILAFSKQGIMTTSVLPPNVFGKVIQTLDSESIKLITARADLLKQYNLLTMAEHTTIDNETETERETASHNKQNRRQFILIGVFIVLLLVLIGVLFITKTIKI